jgi:hypothetical protein
LKFGRARFYADEHVEQELIDFIRVEGYRVFSAKELRLSPRDDRFHLQEARRRKCILLTRDQGFLNTRRFPFTNLTDTALVVLHTQARRSETNAFGYLLTNLLKEVADSGRQNVAGMKIEIKGPKMTLHARIRGRIRREIIDTSRPPSDVPLFIEGERDGAA